MTSRIRPLSGQVSRRTALHMLGGAAAAPFIVGASVLGRNAPSERIGLGVIGTGNQGSSHVGVLLGMPDVQVLAVCDPFRSKREAAKQRVEAAYAERRAQSAFQGCMACSDFRDLVARPDIDAVFIASPEHWHALHTIAAAKAGKDVYCEKAMARTIAEGRAMVAAVRRYGRVFQVGTQLRSSAQFRRPCELVRNGYLGKLQTIKVGDPKGYPGPQVREEPIPEGLDYDLWVGPAPWSPYVPDRMVNLRGWMLSYDCTVGFPSGWGQHEIDIAQWGNGTDHTTPIEVEGRATFPSEGLNDTAATWHAEYAYANGVRLIFTSDDENPHGVRFEGTEGSVSAYRSGTSASPESLLTVGLRSADVPLYESHNHHRNFLDCVRTRREPICPVEAGHHTYVICNLCDMSARLGRRLRWDPDREECVNDEEANRMLFRAMRPPWEL